MVCVWFDPFWTQKHTFIVAWCHQFFVADSFKRPFWVHASHKKIKINIFFWLISSVLLRLTDGWNLVFRDWNYKKLFNNHEKAAKKKKELLKHYFWLHSVLRISCKILQYFWWDSLQELCKILIRS